MNAIQALDDNVDNDAAMQNKIYLYHGSERIVFLDKPLSQPQSMQPVRNDEATQVNVVKYMHGIFMSIS